MTTENRRFITLDEIAAIEFECKNQACGAKLTLTFTRSLSAPMQCPRCQSVWFPSNPAGLSLLKCLTEFVQAGFELEKQRDVIGCSLRLQVPPE
jgi:hypothetical protein